MKKKILGIKLTNNPVIILNPVLFHEKEETIKNKNKKQFMTTVSCVLIVKYKFNNKINKLELYAPAGYSFDGATIPFNIGKGNMRFPIPALFHDLMCDYKYLVDYDRQFASEIFKQSLILCGTNPLTADIMYRSVEMYQKIFCNWRKNDG